MRRRGINPAFPYSSKTSTVTTGHREAGSEALGAKVISTKLARGSQSSIASFTATRSMTFATGRGLSRKLRHGLRQQGEGGVVLLLLLLGTVGDALQGFQPVKVVGEPLVC